MKNRLFAHPGWLTAAALCFALAGFFRFSLVGYGTMALLFAVAGAVIALYLLMPRWFRVALTAVLLAGTLLFFAAEIPVIRAAGGEPEREADYLIVLGAGVCGSVPSRSMLDRLHGALAYLEAHPACVAVLSGGKGTGEDLSEAEAMASWLLDNGVSEDRLLLEDRATNTAENLRFSFALIPEEARVAVCSSEYHLCRAQYMAKTMGREVFGVPGATGLSLLRLNYFIREALGMVHYALFGV
ncbi:MAG: YdcF family protein [Oscillospiraceae bacterium]|nr:YdcF family protein [Oscillospiraceae bacterium]